MYNLPVLVACCSLSCLLDISTSSTVASVSVPALKNMELHLLSDEDEKSLHGMEVAPHVPSGDAQLYQYDYAPQQQQKPLLDHTWVPEVTEVEPGPLYGVELSWEPRGWAGIEYLVSWAEEGGMVSGHLVTKDTKAEVSLWPGMKYYIQIELLDFQGNTMMKSHASPVMFQITSVGTTTTSSTTTDITDDYVITTTTTPYPSSESSLYSTSPSISPLSLALSPLSSSSISPLVISPSSISPLSSSSKFSSSKKPEFSSTSSSIAKSTLKPSTAAFTTVSPSTILSTTTDLPTTKLQISSTTNSSLDVVNIQRNNIEESNNLYAENVHLPNNIKNEVIIDYPSRIEVLDTFDNHREDVTRVDVLQIYEVEGSNSVNNMPGMSAMVVWGAGVTMGALLVLCLCVLALWVLRKSRKIKVPEYLEESVISSNLSSCGNSDNQIKSSWKFEQFSDSPSKENLVTIREPPPSGIDNASLVENYIIVMENPYHSRPLPPLPPVRELRY